MKNNQSSQIIKQNLSKLVIFIDFGGVYFTSAVRPVTEKFSKKFSIQQKKIFASLTGLNWTEHVEGRWNERVYWDHVPNDLNISQKQTQELRKSLYSYSIPNNGMARLVRNLKKKYTVAALSSITIGWVESLEKKYKISKIFHHHHYSYDYGVDKPNVELFLKATERMNAKPENCILIDDNRAFLAAVKKTGAKTILFKNSKQLEKQLRKMSVDI